MPWFFGGSVDCDLNHVMPARGMGGCFCSFCLWPICLPFPPYFCIGSRLKLRSRKVLMGSDLWRADVFIILKESRMGGRVVLL